MHRIWKEVLIPSPAQFDARGRRFSITPEQVRQAHRNASLMLSRGVPIPCVFEHVNLEAGDPDEWKARYAKYCFGHIGASRLATAGDVRAGIASAVGTLLMRHDVDDPEDVKRLRKVKYVSPKVYPGYRDSRGGVYHGTTVSHSALTPTPVQFWQRPFKLPRDDSTAPRTGYDPPAAAPGPPASRATPTPVQFWQRPFELSRGAALYLSYTPPEGPTVPNEGDDKGKTGAGDAGRGELGALIDALREIDLTIPDEVRDIAGLIIAIKATRSKPAADADLDLDDDLDLDAAGTGAGDAGATAPAGGAPMLMSDARAEPFRTMTRRDLVTRVKGLLRSGRIDRPTAQRLAHRAQAVELSFTTAGDMVNRPDVFADVEAYERLPKGLAFTAKGGRPAPDELELSATRVEAPGTLQGAETTAEDVIRTQEALAKRFSAAPAAK